MLLFPRSIAILTGVVLLSVGSAGASTFNYNANGGAAGYSGTGTFTASDNGNGSYTITGITGTYVTGLIAPGLYHSNDNLLFPSNPLSLDAAGFGFTSQNPGGAYRVDIYADSSSSTGYSVISTDTDNFTSTAPLTFSLGNTAVTPEPSTLMLVGTGLLTAFEVGRRRLAGPACSTR